MIKKGDRTRIAILKTANELFSEKGYSAVTMNDFCERHGLSRGGLYRHFASTREIFIAMLESDKDNTSNELEKAISLGVSAKQMFIYFMNREKQQIQLGGGRLSIAIYEFCNSNPDQKSYLDLRFTSAIEILEKLIRYGQSRHEYLDCDAKETASHIIVFLEGLRLSSSVISFSETMIEKQLRYLYAMVVVDDKPIDT
jgi:AcrR family transcriptional regulator